MREERDKARWRIFMLRPDSRLLDNLKSLASEFGLPKAAQSLEDVKTLQTSLADLKQHVGGL